MPKIKLKPNSAEFACDEPKTARRHCDILGCQKSAQHRAPKNRALGEYHFFCFEHVSEYNRAWNFFSGMVQSDIEDHIIKSMTGDRPTWRFDNYAGMEEELRRKTWKAGQFSEKEHKKTGAGTFVKAHTPEHEAMAVMGLEPPLSLKEIKSRYRTLAKKHHPDVNKNAPEAEELLKTINMAYTVLKVAYEKFDKLPERN